MESTIPTKVTSSNENSSAGSLHISMSPKTMKKWVITLTSSSGLVWETTMEDAVFKIFSFVRSMTKRERKKKKK